MKLQNFRGKSLAGLFLHSSSCASNGCCKWYHSCQPLSWRCFLSQEIVAFNTESRPREECKFKSSSCFWIPPYFLWIKNNFFLMVKAEQIELTYKNNFCVQACACISQRSLTGSKVLLLFLFFLWSCLLCGARLSFGSCIDLHSSIQWALGLVIKFGAWETRVGTVICEFLIVATATIVEPPSWARPAVQLVK